MLYKVYGVSLITGMIVNYFTGVVSIIIHYCISPTVFQMKSEPDSPSSVGVMDRSRLLLCALTFFCLSLNPLPSLLDSEASGSPNLSAGHGPSRTLVWFPTHTQDFGEQADASVCQGS